MSVCQVLFIRPQPIQSRLMFAVITLLTTNLSAAEPVNFQRDVRPLLSEACFHCHGPDDKHREAELRLDVGDALPDGLIVAGDPAASELIKRITSDDPDLKMPPPDSGKGAVG